MADSSKFFFTEMNNSAAVSLLANSTRNKQNHEDLAIGARYIDY